MSYPYLESAIADLTGFDTGTQYIPTFGLLVAAAFLVALWLLKREITRSNPKGITYEKLEPIIFIALVVGFVGAKLFHVVEYLEYGFFNQFFSRAGFSIYGGMVFGFATTVFLLRRRKLPVVPTLDLLAPFLFVGYGIGRLGCQISGDGDWGMAVDLAAKPDWLPMWLWAQTYINNVAGVLIPSPGVYPTPIYESIMAFAGYFLLKVLKPTTTKFVGMSFALYLMVTGINRFFVEFIRINERYSSFELSQAQFISLFLFCAGIVLLLRSRKGFSTP